MSFVDALSDLQAAHADELRYLAREHMQEATEWEAERVDLMRELLAFRTQADSVQPGPVIPGDFDPSPTVRPPRGEVAAAAAMTRWNALVQEPPGQNSGLIDGMIRSCGWTYSVASKDVRDARRAAGQPNPDTYRVNGDFSWCGVFVGDAWKQAGIAPEALPDFRDRYKRRPLMMFSSCYRLVSHWARNTARVVEPQSAQIGDVVIVGAKPGSSKGAKHWGSHVTMALGAPVNGEIPTVEGNAKGAGPNGERYEGVIRRSRPLASNNPKTYRVLWVLRPLDEDFAAAT
jgi:hypothetical protein